MSRRVAAAWAAFAIFGVVGAAGVSIAASRLTGQHVALSDEPITAGNKLVPSPPRVRAKPVRRHAPRRHRHPAPPAAPGAQPTVPAPAKPANPPARAYTPPPPAAAPARTTPTRSKAREHEMEREPRDD